MHYQPTEQHAIALDDLFTPPDLAAQYPNILTPTSVQWQLRRRDENGLESACVRMGKRLFISKSRYEQWLATQTDAARRGRA